MEDVTGRRSNERLFASSKENVTMSTFGTNAGTL